MENEANKPDENGELEFNNDGSPNRRYKQDEQDEIQEDTTSMEEKLEALNNL